MHSTGLTLEEIAALRSYRPYRHTETIWDYCTGTSVLVALLGAVGVILTLVIGG